jgi:hypothetical protein
MVELSNGSSRKDIIGSSRKSSDIFITALFRIDFFRETRTYIERFIFIQIRFLLAVNDDLQLVIYSNIIIMTLIGIMVVTVSSIARISHLYVRFDHAREEIRHLRCSLR